MQFAKDYASTLSANPQIVPNAEESKNNQNNTETEELKHPEEQEQKPASEGQTQKEVPTQREAEPISQEPVEVNEEQK